MKKIRSKSKKGFTLVELIVVLVILAILAAMLVPALTGYIKRAREEKEYQTASTVYSAAQAVITEQYGRGKIAANATSITLNTFKNADGKDAVLALAGVDTNAVTTYTFNFSQSGDNAYIISGGSVTISGSVYTLTIDSGIPSWSAAASSASGSAASVVPVT